MLPLPDERTEITVEELDALRGTESPFRLVDCREADEFDYCRLEGAELIPLSGFAETAVARLGADHDQSLVVYCHHGMRSLQATRFLRQRGFRNTFSLHGGIEAWSVAIDPEVPRY